jgi:2-oxoglutarate ferredoxin oxidoreductase subunit alpha
MRPFPTQEVAEVLSNAKKTISVETNYFGQLADIIQEKTGISLDHRIVKYDGRHFSQEELTEALRNVLEDGGARVTVSHLSA